MLLSEQPTIHLAFGVHNHQPAGNWDRIIEDAYQKAYLPFLETLARHPKVHVTLHYSGFLLEWILAHHPDFLTQLRQLVNRGQVELVTGGHYAPILAVIPDEDKVLQVQHLNGFLRRQLGAHPEGIWLAGQVWEPHLVKPLSDAGARWTALDEGVFQAEGLKGAQLLGYYQTEDQGRTLEVFPIHAEMGRLVPFVAPEQVIDYLRKLATTDGNRLVFALDDGEKFGVWPNSYQVVHEQGWLDRFFTLLEEHSDWIRCTTVRDYRAQRRPLGRVYLPSWTYPRMQEWALPAEEALAFGEARQLLPERFRKFFHGASWRHFLVRYPESNNLHKKMLRVADQVAATSGLSKPPVGGGTDPWEEAQLALWRGQANDSYWHGVFGGLYLTHLRSASYQALLTAERLCDGILHGDRPFLEVERVDFDCDGKPEVLVSRRDLNLYFNLEGGALFELDHKPTAFNLLDTLARRPEAYHQQIARATTLEAFHREGSIRAIYEVVLTKEAGLERYLYRDWYRRTSFVDHFLHPDSHLASFHDMSYGEQGDFVNQEYQATVERTADGASVTFEREGHVWVGSDFWPVTVKKVFRIPSEPGKAVTCHYTVTNRRDRGMSLWFGIEFNANFLSGDATDRRYMWDGQGPREDTRLGSRGELGRCRALAIEDTGRGLGYRLNWNRPATVWRFPIETISMSEGGCERVYQSSVMMPHWRLDLGPQGSFEVTIEQRVESLPVVDLRP